MPEVVKKSEFRVKGEIFEVHVEQYPDGLYGYRIMTMSSNSGMEKEVRHEAGKFQTIADAESHANMAARSYYNRERLR